MSMARYQVREPEDSDLEPRALISRAAGLGLNTAGGTTNNIIYANKLEIHNRVEIHNHYCSTGGVGSTSTSTGRVGLGLNTAGVGSTPAGASKFEGNQPSFQLVKTVTGIDFGIKLAKRYYEAEKHIDNNANLVNNNVERAAHVVTLGLSSKRFTLVIVIFFDTDLLRQFADAWPSRIPLQDFETLLHKLGANVECTRTKVEKDRFSLYLFGIKKRGEHFSQQSFQMWVNLCHWADHLDPPTDNASASSSVISPALILELAAKAVGTVLLGG